MNNTFNIIIIVIIIIILIIFYFFNTNPGIINLTKSEMLDYIRPYTPKYRVINKKTQDTDYIYSLVRSLKYPLVFKPDFCHNFANNVKIINNSFEALNYIQNSIDNKIIIQDYYFGPFEATIYYKQHPITNETSIVVNERLPNNKDKTKPWIWTSDIFVKNGYRNKDRPELETIKLKNKLFEISNRMPGVFYGRYDVRFKSHEELKNGKNFTILEFNECGFDTRASEDKTFKQNLKIYWDFYITRMKFGFLNSLNPKYTDVLGALKHNFMSTFKINKCKHEKYFLTFFSKAGTNLIN